jgi:type IV pilus assembly PilX-like protein
MCTSSSPGMRLAQHGAALLVGLIFLVVLSLVAVIAMKGTLMEMRMVNNVSEHEQAFETSESLRLVVSKMFSEHAQVRGWPVALMGGDKADSLFSTYPANCTAGSDTVGKNGVSCKMIYAMSIRRDAITGLPVNLYTIRTKAGENIYDPATWMVTHPEGDVKIGLCSGDQTPGCTADTVARIWVRPDGTSVSPGFGAAQSAGYRGLGEGLAGGSTHMFFEVVSAGVSPGNARVVTHSQYQQAILN